MYFHVKNISHKSELATFEMQFQHRKDLCELLESIDSLVFFFLLFFGFVPVSKVLIAKKFSNKFTFFFQMRITFLKKTHKSDIKTAEITRNELKKATQTSSYIPTNQ